jgi:hypothetical protein
MNLEIILTLGPPYVNNFSKSVIQQEWKNQDKKLFYQSVVLIFYLQIDLTI